jgi:hypothetical protein
MLNAQFQQLATTRLWASRVNFVVHSKLIRAGALQKDPQIRSIKPVIFDEFKTVNVSVENVISESVLFNVYNNISDSMRNSIVALNSRVPKRSN